MATALTEDQKQAAFVAYLNAREAKGIDTSDSSTGTKTYAQFTAPGNEAEVQSYVPGGAPHMTVASIAPWAVIVGVVGYMFYRLVKR